MTAITVKCVGCGTKNEFKGEEIPTEQPFCEACGMPMIAEQVAMDTKR